MRVLIVDDDPNTLASLARASASEGTRPWWPTTPTAPCRW